MSKPIIVCSDLSFIYKDSKKPALKNISFTINEGEFVGIIGPTGAGKSTLCWAINGVIPQIMQGKLKGSVEVKGKPSNKTPVDEISQIIGIVQQDAEAQLLMTDIEKEIVFPLENLSLPREEIHRRLEYVINLVNLDEERYRHPFYLSGGQKQRVAVAAALAMEPEVLILDEATSELDPVGAEEIHELAGRLKKEGKTIIMVEHNIDELAKHADRIIVMNQGEILRDGAAHEILTDVNFLQSLGIYPPQVTQTAFHLREDGWQFERLPLNLVEATHSISALRKTR